MSQGAAEGSPDQAPTPPSFTDGWQLGPPDLILEAQAPFHAPASGADVYWNFVFKPEVQATRYAWARFNRANALVKSGRLEEAIGDYRAVVSADPEPNRRLCLR